MEVAEGGLFFCGGSADNPGEMRSGLDVSIFFGAVGSVFGGGVTTLKMI